MTDELITIPRADADRLIASADGTAALLYLHVRAVGSFSRAAAARDLKCDGVEIDRAAELLRRLGLLDKPERPPEQRELPEYASGDIVSRSQADAAFSAVVFEAQRELGRLLSTNDLRLLFGIYDHLGMPADVIMMLTHHCVEEYQQRYGTGRRPTMKYIEKEAWDWADEEVLTVEAAEEHLNRLRERRESVGQLKRILQLSGRDLTPTEDKYLRSWVAMGFTPEAVAVAYDRTVVSTGKLTWRYMDKILHSWSEKKLFTPEEIEAGDPPRRGAQSERRPAEEKRGVTDDMRDLRGLYARLKGKDD